MSIKTGALALVFGLTCQVTQAQAQQAWVVDGDTLRIDGQRFRIFGIDAPEKSQWCGDWPAGLEATNAMGRLVVGKNVTCSDRGRDIYGRTIGLCTVDGVDLGAAMVSMGMAYAFTRYSWAYVKEEAAARQDKLGVHAHGCQHPWEYRREHK